MEPLPLASVVTAAIFLAVLPWTWAARGFVGPSLGVPLTLAPAALFIVVGGIFVWRGRRRDDAAGGRVRGLGHRIGPDVRALIRSPWAYAVLLVIWSFLSVAWSPYPLDSILWSVHLAATVVAFWMLGRVLPLALRSLLAVLVVSACACALYAINAALHDAALGIPSRPYFGLMDPNTATVIFLIAGAAAVYLSARGATMPLRLMSVLAVLILSCVVVLSLSRAALPCLIALLAASAVLAVLGFLPRRPTFAMLGILLAVGGIAVAGSLGLAATGLNVPGTSVPASRPVNAFVAFSESRLGDFSGALLGDSTGRAEIWGAYWRIRDRWLPAGLGAGVDAKVMEASGALEDPRFGGGLRDTHNMLLQLPVQLGLPGLLAGLAMLVLFVWRAIEHRREPVALLMLIAGLPMGLTLAIFDLAVLWVPFAVASVPVALASGLNSGRAVPEEGMLPR